MSHALYDRIGIGYAAYRRPDPRIAARIAAALGAARTVLNVGAGAGSYEPVDRRVTAVEPSIEMIRQRAPSTPVIRASADRLPFRDGSFDATLAILTVHHWPDWRQGLHEMRRIARDRVVLFTWDPAHPGFWLEMRDAQHPIIHAGQGVLYADACAELRELAELLDFPESARRAGDRWIVSCTRSAHGRVTKRYSHRGARCGGRARRRVRKGPNAEGGRARGSGDRRGQALSRRQRRSSP